MTILDTARGDAAALANPACDRARAYGEGERAILSRAGAEAARATIATWEGYAPTPLRSLPQLAARLGVGAVLYKDESLRFSLDSFKGTGGAYAVSRIVAARGRADDLVVTAATDGNHGRSVAWGASRLGARAVIFLPDNASAGREAAIRGFGGEVRRVPGTFDDAVRAAVQAARDNGWALVTDTATPGNYDVPRDVMQGYQLLPLEAERQAPMPTHVFVQAGVGGLAAAVVAHAWETWGAARPMMIVVEPVNAACLFASALAGHWVSVDGDLETIMVGLACGEASPLAWRILQPGADAFVTVADARAEEAMRALAALGVVGGESGVAGLAALFALADDAAARDALRLDPGARILCYGTEGATDPDIYRRIVGRSAAQVRAVLETA